MVLQSTLYPVVLQSTLYPVLQSTLYPIVLQSTLYPEVLQSEPHLMSNKSLSMSVKPTLLEGNSE